MLLPADAVPLGHQMEHQALAYVPNGGGLASDDDLSAAARDAARGKRARRRLSDATHSEGDD